MRIFFQTVSRLVRGLGLLGQLALASMVVTICYDVVMRYVFMMPTDWSLEVNTFLVIFIAVIPSSDVLRTDSHLRIGFFASKLSPAARRRVARASGLVGVGFCALMTWKGLGMALQAYKYGDRMSTPLGTPMVIPYLFIPVGFGLLGLQYLVRLFRPQDEEAQG